MHEHKAPVMTPTGVFNEAQSIGANEHLRAKTQLAVCRAAGTVVKIVDRLAGRPKPGSYTATDLQERIRDLGDQLSNTAGALQMLDNLQAIYDPRGVAVEQIRHDFTAAMTLAPVTGTPVPIDSIVDRFSKAQRLPSSLPTATFPRQCEVEGRKIMITVADPNPTPQTLFDYALHLQQQITPNRLS